MWTMVFARALLNCQIDGNADKIESKSMFLVFFLSRVLRQLPLNFYRNACSVWGKIKSLELFSCVGKTMIKRCLNCSLPRVRKM